MKGSPARSMRVASVLGVLCAGMMILGMPPRRRPRSRTSRHRRATRPVVAITISAETVIAGAGGNNQNSPPPPGAAIPTGSPIHL